MNKNKKPAYRTTLYALVAPPQYVYIGTTRSTDLSAVYRHHTRGRSVHTQRTPIATTDVDMYLLETITASTPTVYKHVVAWLHVFSANGYTPVNPTGSQAHAADLQPETQAIVDQIRREPLRAILSRTRIPAPGHRVTSDLPTAAQAESAAASSKKLTIRLGAQEMEAFTALAQHLQMTQSDTLRHLINHHTTSADAARLDGAILAIHQRMQQRLAAMQREYDILAQRLARLQASPEATAPKMTQRYRAAQAYIQAYGQAILPLLAGAPLPRMGYKRYVRDHPAMSQVTYRPNPAPYLYTPEAILYGSANPPVHFWIGKAADGTRHKIRIYDKTDFVGISPLHPGASLVGVRWLVQTRTAADGAEDLVFALPLPPASVAANTPSRATGDKLSLDDRIAHALTRRNH